MSDGSKRALGVLAGLALVIGVVMAICAGAGWIQFAPAVGPGDF